MTLFGQCLYLLTLLIARKEFEIIYRNVELIFGLPSHSRFAQQFARQVLRHTIFTQLETLKLMLNPEQGYFRGIEKLRETFSRYPNQGFVVIAAHIGSWELVGHVVATAQGKPLVALAKPPKQRFLQSLLQNFRASMRTHILWTDRASLLRDMLNVIKAKCCLVFVMDQRPKSGKGHSVSFMGRSTSFVQGPAAIAKRSGAKVIAIYCLRKEAWTYEVEHKVIDFEKDTSEAELTSFMAESVEEKVRLYPEQWTWNYRRWPQEQANPAEESLPLITIQ